jgi:porin
MFAGRAVRAQTSDDSLIPPLSATFSYTGELVGSVSGGARREATALGMAGADLTVRLRRLIGWQGARAFFSLLGTHGGAPSELVGDVQGVSNMEAPGTVRLEEAWLQQNLFANRLSLLAGRYDLNTEFYRLQSAALFLNSSFGIGPEFGQSGVAGPSIFPNTAVGSRVEFDPSPFVGLRVAVLNGAPVDRPGGAARLFAAADGALLVGEAVVVRHPDSIGMMRQRRFHIGRSGPRPYAAKLALGGWYYTARFPDLSATLPGGDPVLHRGSGGVYLIGDQTVRPAGPGHSGPLTAFVQVGVGDGRVNQIAGYLGGGLTLGAPLAERLEDQLGVAVAAALNGSRFRDAQAAAGMPAGAEVVLEATYMAQLGTWLAAQTDVQYVFHPGGLQHNRNALVLGLRLAMTADIR